MNQTPSALTTHRRAKILLLLALGVVVLIVLYQYFFPSDHSRDHKPSIPVVTATARSGNVPIYISALGGVTPTYSVTVKTQINGQLQQVLFREGQLVKKGDLLAQIDPRPYQAQLMQYQGQLARDTALLNNAKLDLKRYQTLWKQNSVAKQVLDTQASTVQQNEGTVKLDQGLIQNTQLNLTYTRITSPIDGRVGLRLVDPGNYVQVSDPNGIVVINTLNPITVVFTIPEDNVPDVTDQINAGKTLTVEAYDRTQNKLLAMGTLLTIDNQIDPTTGTVKLKALFPNNDNRLFPNQFVNIKLLVKTIQNATIVPTAAIQNGVQGTYVYLLNKDNTVSVKPVTVGATINSDTMVTAGLAPGQIVITEGTDKLVDGSTVTFGDSQNSDQATTGKKRHHHKQ